MIFLLEKSHLPKTNYFMKKGKTYLIISAFAAAMLLTTVAMTSS